MKLYFIVPSLKADSHLERTLESIGARLASNAHVILVCPAPALPGVRQMAGALARAHAFSVEVLEEMKRGVYPAYNDGVRRLLSDGREGRIVFLGAGDRFILPSTTLAEILADNPDVACFKVAGDPTSLRPVAFAPGSRKGLRRLPHHQGMIFSISLGRALLFPENHSIYADVEQRARALLAAERIVVSERELSAVAPAGISGVRSFAAVKRHARGRVAIARMLFMELKQRRLALRYLAGVPRVIARWLVAKKNGPRATEAANAATGACFLERRCKKTANSSPPVGAV